MLPTSEEAHADGAGLSLRRRRDHGHVPACHRVRPVLRAHRRSGGRIVRVAVTGAGVARGRQLRQLPSQRTSRRCGGIASRYSSSSSRRARSRRWSPQPASPCSLEAAVDDVEGIAFSRNALVEPLALLTSRHEHLASRRVASAKRLVLVQVPTPEGRSISVFSVALHHRRWISG